MTQAHTGAWQKYEAGKAYKRRIGLYETVRRNERFYRGDQWYASTKDLPHPVFNLTRRIADYLVSVIAPERIHVTYSDERLPFLDNSVARQRVEEGLSALSEHADYRWQQSRMTALCESALLDAVLSGDGVFYCWWDRDGRGAAPFRGDIRTQLINNTDLFLADVNSTDLQSQAYILLSGRASVDALRAEARENGLSKAEINRIVGDSEEGVGAGDLSDEELEGEEKATYLLYFWKENGRVYFEKSVKSCVIKTADTGLSLYPVAYFNWRRTKDCFHGSAPVNDLIGNQKYINNAYAMVMKHMTDTAFSKVIYDKSRIPEWSNEVGEAIGALGGGVVSDAVSVVGVGQLQGGYLDLIENVILTTKDIMGATEVALGDARADNTSALLLLQQASRLSLKQVRASLARCIGELCDIWADMLCANASENRPIAVLTHDGIKAALPDYALLAQGQLHAEASLEETGEYTPVSTAALLEKLLNAGAIDATDYIRLLPADLLPGREEMLKQIKQKGTTENE